MIRFTDSHFSTAILQQDAAVIQKKFELFFKVDKLSASISKSYSDRSRPDRLLANAVLEHFDFHFAARGYDMGVEISLRSLYIEDKMVSADSEYRHLVTSEDIDHKESSATNPLVHIKYSKCQADSPEFMTKFEGFNQVCDRSPKAQPCADVSPQSVDVEMSTLNVIVTRASIVSDSLQVTD